ncbi:hypothetical protein IMCC3135_13190 [Granulosicoccus antarcticus IMCC3135]|uniref:Uncharacterized protein n=1 Tax=Granulosicoccus antarcticus IMCC3135 TaxID=1192854 RepID=A0A2Z2NQG5_9GAMM|nr:hypothetical protein IMCC3135_13190 [Granulosicoccus antarcticus IMCC3135]
MDPETVGEALLTIKELAEEGMTCILVTAYAAIFSLSNYVQKTICKQGFQPFRSRKKMKPVTDQFIEVFSLYRPEA